MSGLHADSWKEGAQSAVQRLKLAGLDLVQWFSVPLANRALDPAHRLPELGEVGLVVGNTRALWEPFTQFRQAHPGCAAPLDTYVEEQVESALLPLGPAWLGFSHHLSPAPIPIQRYAALSGLAQMSPVGLSIHPTYGPWIALRAVAVFDADSVPFSSSGAAHPCDTCTRPCVAPFEEAMRAPMRPARRFLPVRMSCPVGVEFRYGKEQLDYHYGGALPVDP